jgi:hypothetical protein
MAVTVAALLERRLGQIAGIVQITSTSSLGTTSMLRDSIFLLLDLDIIMAMP